MDRIEEIRADFTPVRDLPNYYEIYSIALEHEVRSLHARIATLEAAAEAVAEELRASWGLSIAMTPQSREAKLLRQLESALAPAPEGTG